MYCKFCKLEFTCDRIKFPIVQDDHKYHCDNKECLCPYCYIMINKELSGSNSDTKFRVIQHFIGYKCWTSLNIETAEQLEVGLIANIL